MVTVQRRSKILNAQGQPITVTDALTDEQTARIGYMGKEFENHPTSGLTPLKLANILQGAEHGELAAQCDLFEDMEEKDGHIFAELSKRKRALLGLKWRIDPPRDATTAEKTQAQRLSDWLSDMDDFEDHLFDMADAIGKGYSMMSIQWNTHSHDILPTLKHCPARWFTVNEQADRETLLLRTDSGAGEPLWDFGWVKHIHKSKSGYVGRSGLHRVLAWPFLFKNYSVRDLAEFLEIYGIPARLGTYPSGASEAEKMTLLRAVVSVGHNAAGIMPEGMMMDFKEAAKGASDPFQAMIEWCESTQSKAILGGTLTTTAANTGLGSGQSDVHNEVRHDLLISDARQIAGTLTRDLIWPMAALNFVGANPNRKPRFSFITADEEDITSRAQRDKILFEIGYKLSPETVNDVYGKGYQAIAAVAKGELAATKASANGQALNSIEDFNQPLLKEGQPVIDNMIDTIKHLLDDSLNRGHSIEQFQNRLLSVYGDMDSDQLANIMQLGLAAADLMGRFDVNEHH